MRLIRYSILFLVMVCLCSVCKGHAERLGAPEARILQRYGSMPKGLILEGSATGFEKLRVIQYIPARNGFRVNDSFYPSPVSKNTLLEIANALAKDDRIGVSIIDNARVLSFGGIVDRSPLSNELAKADQFLMGFVFGTLPPAMARQLPGGYMPRRAHERKVGTICTSLLNTYTFQKFGTTYRRSGVRLRVLLVPMADQRSPNGGYLPAATGEELIPLQDQQNAAQLMQNQAAYLKVGPIAQAVAIGEAAAFMRMLRDQYQLTPARLAVDIAHR